ncbi:MAG: septal ring lytic transglycosylase RlpA family protein, partial [Burkholderiaceae bacterium]
MIAGTRSGRVALVCGAGVLALLAGCSSTPTSSRAGKAGSSSGGGYYLDDGPGSGAPTDLAAIPDARPRREPIVRATTRPYVVFGRTYTPRGELAPYRERGVASWYGRKFHGQKTSSGEVYDMYGMTAAHPTLPIPSYVRVTSLGTGNSVVVRVNDRGPFLNDRLIDLSWTAAAKLGYVNAGHTRVEVEQITRFDGDDGMPVRVPDNVASAAGKAAGDVGAPPSSGPAASAPA